MNRLTLILLVIFLFISGQFTISNIKLLKTPAQDFEYFYTAGKLVGQGENPYITWKGGLIRNPPPTMLFYALLPLLPIHISQLVFYTISFGAFFLGSYIIFKSLNLKISLKLWLTYLTLILLFFPFRYTLGSGQLNNLLFLCFALAFYLLERKKSLWSSVPLSIAIILKVIPIFFLFIFFLQKRFKLLLMTIVDIVILELVTFLVFGLELFENYFQVSKSYFDYGASSYYNQSLAGFLTRTWNSPQLTKWILLLTLVIALLILTHWMLNLKKRNFIINSAIWNIGILYILIFSPFSWQHYFNLTIFPLVLTFYHGYYLKLNYKFLGLVSLSYLLIGLNIKNPRLYEGMGMLSSMTLSHVLFGTLLLLVLNIYLLRKSNFSNF